MIDLVLFLLVVLASSLTGYRLVLNRPLETNKGRARDATRHFIMSTRIRRFLPVLKRINKLGEKAKSQYVKKCNKEFVDCISECAKNVLRGNVPLSARQNAKLRRNKQNLRALSIKKTSLRKKRRIIQKGLSLIHISEPTRPY